MRAARSLCQQRVCTHAALFILTAHLHQAPPLQHDSCVFLPGPTSQPASQPARCESVACVYSHNPFSSFLPLVPVCLPVFSFAVFPSLLLLLIHHPPPPLPRSFAHRLSFSAARAHTHTHTHGHMLYITGSGLQTGFSSSCLLDLSSKTSLFFMECSGPSSFLYFLFFIFFISIYSPHSRNIF